MISKNLLKHQDAHTSSRRVVPKLVNSTQHPSAAACGCDRWLFGMHLLVFGVGHSATAAADIWL